MAQFAYYRIAFIIAVIVAFTSGHHDSFFTGKTTEFWRKHAEEKIKQSYQSSERPSNFAKRAKNVILFVGDGMGPTVVTAGRIYNSQKKAGGPKQSMSKENYQNPLAFEKLPYSAFVKTHSSDHHVTESAASATSIMCGAKVPSDSVSMFWESQMAANGTTETLQNYELLNCIAAKALMGGKKAGLVTTTRVTHATPSVLYAHQPLRMRETGYYEQRIMDDGKVHVFKDIAEQMLTSWPGTNLTVMLGGGLTYFKPCPPGSHYLPRDVDPYLIKCRYDNRNIINEWLNNKSSSSRKVFVDNVHKLNSINNFEQVDQVLGLFSNGNMDFVLDRPVGNASYGQPTLPEMAEFAVKFLSEKSKDEGYFLLIEGGRIDSALHMNKAKKAFEELVAFNEAIEKVLAMVNLNETLVIVTADHSHNVNLKGYATKNISLLANLPYPNELPFLDNDRNWTMISFADGPAGTKENKYSDPESKDYEQPSMIRREWSSHGGEDVAAYATGPWSSLFTGLLENTDIFYFMCYAMRLDSCHFHPPLSQTDGADSSTPSKLAPKEDNDQGQLLGVFNTSGNIYFYSTIVLAVLLVASVLFCVKLLRKVKKEKAMISVA